MYYLTTKHNNEKYYFTGKPSSHLFYRDAFYEFDEELWTRTPGKLATKFTDGEITQRNGKIREHDWTIERAY